MLEKNNIINSVLEKHNIINSVEDGNCAFNAFLLSFVDLILADALDNRVNQNYLDFVASLGLEKENIAEKDWVTFKKFLEKNKEQPEFIQITLAPYLRKLLVILKQQTPENLAPAFQSEFREFVYKKLFLPRSETAFEGGDIFKRIDAFQTKFAEATNDLITRMINKHNDTMQVLVDIAVKNNLNNSTVDKNQETQLAALETEIQNQLMDLTIWYNTEGLKAYYEYLSVSGKWVGDAELKIIGDYFDINVSAYKNFKVSFGHNNGKIPFNAFKPALKDNQVKLLLSRRIIEETENGYALQEISEEELNTRLTAIDLAEDVLDYWINSDKQLEKLYIPEEWSTSLKENLIERGAITKQGYFFTDLDYETLYAKLSTFERKKEFIDLWKTYYEVKPHVLLANPEANHWFYMQPKNLQSNWESLKHLVVSNFNYNESSLAEILLYKYLQMQSNNAELSPLLTLNDTRSLTERSLQNHDDDSEIKEINESFEDSQTTLFHPFFIDGDEANSEYASSEYDGVVDSNSKRNRNRSPNNSPTFGYATFGLYGRSSLSSDQSSSRSPSPPHKKQKVFDFKLSTEADEVLQKLDELKIQHPNNEGLDTLELAFRSIKKNKEISSENSLIIFDFHDYLKIKNIEPIPVNIEPLTKFTKLHYNELLSKSNNDLQQRLLNLLYFILDNSNSSDSNQESTNVFTLLHKIWTSIHKTDALGQKICKEIQDFDLQQTKVNYEQSDFKEKYAEIKELLSFCKMVGNKTNIQESAENIISLISAATQQQSEFPSLIKYLSEVGESNLQALLKFPLENIDIKIKKELLHFCTVYRNYYSEVPNEDLNNETMFSIDM